MEMPELTVEEMPTEALIPYANNAKEHSQLQVEQIANSIEAFGFNDPVGVWENAQGELEIVEGHGRVMAAKRLGIDVLPVIRLDHLTDEQRRAYTHVHNQTTLNSGFDSEMLEVDLEVLDFDWDDFGFDGGFDAISDMLSGNEFCSSCLGGSESGDVSITFVFKAEDAEIVKDYIRNVGKEEVAAKIAEEAKIWA